MWLTPHKEGVYQGREITLGPRAKNYYLVLAGLEAGEHVVVNGNFKIDSQVQILGKPSMMGIAGGHRADAHPLPERVGTDAGRSQFTSICRSGGTGHADGDGRTRKPPRARCP